MSRKKKPKYKDYAASMGDNDYFGTIFDSMCKSIQYQNLNIGAKQFYTICRVQAKSSLGKSCLYNHGKDEGVTYSENDFVFPASHLTKYGYDRCNASRYFRELINAGFIEKKEKNNHRKKVNVYSFSSKWKDKK